MTSFATSIEFSQEKSGKIVEKNKSDRKPQHHLQADRKKRVKGGKKRRAKGEEEKKKTLHS